MASSGSTAPVFVVPALETTANGVEPGAPIGGDRLIQRVDPKPEAVVGRDRADAIGHHAGELGGFQHRVMRLIGRVEHAATDLGAEMPLARAEDRVQRAPSSRRW